MIKLFTDSDLDGVGCAIIAKLLWNNTVDIQYCTAKNINTVIENFINDKLYEKFDFIYITDLSVSKELAELINNNENIKKRINIIDHHKTARYLNMYTFAIVQSEFKIDDECEYNYPFSSFIKEGNDYYYRYSGTSLFYRIFEHNFYNVDNKIINQFVELVRQYDTWTWKYTKNQDAKNLADILGILGIETFVEEYVSILKYNLQNNNKNNNFEIPKFYLPLLKYKRKEIEEYIKYKMNNIKFSKDSKGNQLALVFCDRIDCRSELGNKICEGYKDIDYCVLVYDGGISLRSIGDFDVSAIAKEYGGGGHKNSAGFSFTTSDLLENLMSHIF
jgi:oligoribonuclease NrnB/cAMP/cGMP phosphodiesterase (DHH superfamily)